MSNGQIRFEAKVPAEIDCIVACLNGFSPDIASVGFEAGALSQYLTYGLAKTGFEVICMEARQVLDFHVPARAHHRVLRVARTIADLGSSDSVRTQHVAEAAVSLIQNGRC